VEAAIFTFDNFFTITVIQVLVEEYKYVRGNWDVLSKLGGKECAKFVRKFLD
jgi:hypothetical protein